MTRARKPARQDARQIRFLHAHALADGRFGWYWKPSPRLRTLGFANQALGITDDRRASPEIARKAAALNESVAALNERPANQAEAGPAPHRWRFADLIDAYRLDDSYRQLKPASKREYDSRIRQLEYWAEDGKLALRAIDRDMVADLRKALLADGTGSKFKCAAMLRVLRLLMRFAVSRRAIVDDPTQGVRIPTTQSRRNKMDWAEVEAIAADCRRRGEVGTALLFEVAFWTVQRRGDLLALNRMAWRPIEGMEPRDRATLANERGDVMGFTVIQNKTAVPIKAPVPPFLHAAIEAQLARHQFLFGNPGDGNAALHERTVQRRVREALDRHGLTDMQLRDLRRSGMSALIDLGADRSDVFTISGHAVLGKRTIVDTYLPRDARASCRAIATAVRTLQARTARDADEAAAAGDA